MSGKKEKCFEQMERALLKANTYIIYGAGVVAYGVYMAVKNLYGLLPQYFVVTEYGENPSSYDGIPVLEVSKADSKFQIFPVLVAAPEIYHSDIGKNLGERGSSNIFYIDSHMEYLLMKRYLKKTEKIVLSEDLGCKKKSVQEISDNPKDFVSVYMAKSHKDKKLKKHYEIPEWIIPVQAGKSCTDQMLADISDAEGENISEKNPDYCELTVTYWVWKNCHSRYKGICHYRRKLILEEAALWNCAVNDVDLILPLPFVCYPNAKGQYGRYISREDRACLERAIGDVSPEYSEVLYRLDRQPLFYDYNMLIAKEDIYNDYAEWLFSVLFQAEKYCLPEGKIRGDRYAGYLGELLTSLYIFKNSGRYKIVHAERDWMT